MGREDGDAEDGERNAAQNRTLPLRSYLSFIVLMNLCSRKFCSFASVRGKTNSAFSRNGSEES